ncbi:MAG: hypothetical protein A2Y12_03275 [Planctomycetes bacterium GWF2_42_9]|nr:MAG: hypothetical protein A2Y12_03275 [Planctomycetes bacterium GWF2_42_9]
MIKNKITMLIMAATIITIGGCCNYIGKERASSLKDKQIKIVAFGDSITAAVGLGTEQKWTSLLEKKLNSHKKNIHWTVVNSGIGGNTSREGLMRFEKDVLSFQSDIVLVQFGGNDAGTVADRAVSVEEFKHNLNIMYEAIKTQMMLLSYPPIIDDWHSDGKSVRYAAYGGFDRYVELYRQAARDFCREKNVKIIDIETALRKACKEFSTQEIVMKDGIHLTAKGNEIICQTVYNDLKKVKK